MSTHAFQAPKGTRDFYPSDLAVRRHIEHAWRSASIDCGFDEVEGPAFEHLELYTAKSGEGIVNELFSFRRAGGENDYALRPEFTPTLARMVAARAGALPVPVKWFAIPNMFRAERPQRGRLREFVQWNIDTLGVEGAATDIDVIACAILALERLGLTPLDVQVRLSHRVAIGRLLSALGVSEEKSADAMTLLDRRDKLKPDEFATRAQALGLSAEGVASFDLAARATQPLADEISALATKIGIPVEALAALDEVRAAATRAGILEWCSVDIGIVRGLALDVTPPTKMVSLGTLMFQRGVRKLAVASESRSPCSSLAVLCARHFAIGKGSTHFGEIPQWSPASGTRPWCT